MIKYLTAEHVISFHKEILRVSGGLAGIRSKNLLLSALAAPKASFAGQQMYPLIDEKAAVYLYHLARNHPFNDGNKRTAYISTLVFMELNQGDLKFDVSSLEDVVVDVAQGKFSKDQLLRFFLGGVRINSH